MVVRQSLAERPPRGVRYALVNGRDRGEALFGDSLQDLALEDQRTNDAVGLQVAADDWQDLVPSFAQVVTRPTLVTLLRSEDQAYAVRAMARFGGQAARDSDVLRVLGALSDSPSKETVIAATNTLAAWHDLERTYGVLTSREVADRVGSRARNRAGAANDLAKAGRILAVKRAGRHAFPAYQFGPDGTVIPVLADVLMEFRKAGWSDLSIALWAASPSGWLSDRAPADIWMNPENADRIRHAAHQDATT